MRLTEEDMKQRRDFIIENAYLSFSTKGIQMVNIRKIAEDSKVSENTIYRYFDNKEKLVLETLVYVWNGIMTEIETEVNATKDYLSKSGFEQIQIWIQQLKELYKQKKEFVLFSFEAKIYLLRHKEKLDAQHRNVMLERVHYGLLAAIDKGKADGSITIQRDSEDIFYAIWGTLRGYIAKIVIYGELEDEDSPWEKRYDVVETGILCALENGWKD